LPTTGRLYHVAHLHLHLHVRVRQLTPRKHRSLRLIVHPLQAQFSTVQITLVFPIKRQRSLIVAVHITYGSMVNNPQNIVVLTRQSLAATNKVLHCFSLRSALSAGWISVIRTNNMQMLHTIETAILLLRFASAVAEWHQKS
jgi:hypothetical protein